MLHFFSEGSSDGTIRVWEVETGRCLKVFNVGADVHRISWNPSPDRPILAAIVYAFANFQVYCLFWLYYASLPFVLFDAVATIFCFLMLKWGMKKLK